ncbi:hypothetical protein SAMN02745157_0194 [Kaistia soli DSM 19436]|uniref:Uncharacterized protein n=1 Tax=Kaistia soli DSM 19436 TaxID=1122133 RepID=A0A1M5PNK8_9HYPH|nr:hypothetical protein [Kaistia soli]SHH03327.1 hypothetical protein SAMN02745157_0194 [Kaistia soli DSM 19436]
MTLLLTDEELDLLPPDPLEAFLEFEAIARERTLGMISDSDTYGEDIYVSNIFAMAEVFDIESIIDVRNEYGGPKSILELYGIIRNRVDTLSLTFRLEKFKQRRSGHGPVLSISADIIETLRFHLTQMRSAVDKVEGIPIRKREAIVKRLSELDYEISTSRTKWESWLDLALELADTTSEVAEKLAPTKKMLDAIFKRLAKAKRNAQSLPSPDKQKQIEHQSDDEIESEDDIPF